MEFCQYVFPALASRAVLTEYSKQAIFFLLILVFIRLGRFLLEFLRLDISLVNGFNINQVFFAIVFVCAGIGMYLRHRPVQKL